MLRKLIILSVAATAAWMSVSAADPTSTNYTFAECEGSLTPYPDNIAAVAQPDSLEAVMINHVGRHGARYPASSSNCMKLRAALQKADSAGTLTELGRELARINDLVIARSNGQWGALDSLGMAEQRSIATRMFRSYPRLFESGTVNALSSYSPRAMMSMMTFVHQLDRMSNKANYTTSTGRINSPLLRPFDTDEDYIEFRKSDEVINTYDNFFEATCPTSAIARVLGKDYPFESADQWRELAITQYYVIAGLAAMGIDYDASRFFTREEYNALWSCFNFRQYLQRTATTLSTCPAEIASDLALPIIKTTDDFIDGRSTDAVILRFGHAETLMPLASLLKLPGCYYMTNYFDTVALHWKDFYVVPMAANVQFILFKSTKSGRYYVRIDYNETPVKLIPGCDSIYLPWSQARDFMMHCIPFYAQ